MIGKTTSILLIGIAMLAITAISCQSVADRLTPCNVPQPVSEYLEIVPLIEVTSLYDFREMMRQILVKHRETQKDVIRAAQDDRDYFNDAVGPAQTAIDQAVALQSSVLGDENSPGLLGYLAGLAGLGGGTLLGRNFLRRPQDWTEEEVQLEIEKAKNGNGG